MKKGIRVDGEDDGERVAGRGLCERGYGYMVRMMEKRLPEGVYYKGDTGRW